MSENPKQIIEDSLAKVDSARYGYTETNNTLLGVVAILEHQNILSECSADFIRAQLNRLETKSKQIEIEFYTLRNLIEDNKWAK